MTFTLPYPTNPSSLAYINEARLAVADYLRTSEPEAVEDLTGRRLKAEVVFHAPNGEREGLQHAAACATVAVVQALGLAESQLDHVTVSRGPKSRNGGSVTYTLEPDEGPPF